MSYGRGGYGAPPTQQGYGAPPTSGYGKRTNNPKLTLMRRLLSALNIWSLFSCKQNSAWELNPNCIYFLFMIIHLSTSSLMRQSE